MVPGNIWLRTRLEGDGAVPRDRRCALGLKDTGHGLDELAPAPRLAHRVSISSDAEQDRVALRARKDEIERIDAVFAATRTNDPG